MRVPNWRLRWRGALSLVERRHQRDNALGLPETLTDIQPLEATRRYHGGAVTHSLSIIFNYRQCATAPAKDRKVIWNRQGDGLSHAFSLVGNTLVRLSGSLAGRLHSSCKDSRTEVRSRRRESISSRMSVQDTQRLVEQGGLKLVRVVDLPGAGQSSAEQARTEPSGDTRGSGLRSCARAA
jgi:hypothetical protein